MSAAPLVSVIIPIYNGARFIADALASVRAQNYAPLEILILDDGSTDETAQIAQRQADVRYIALEHRGLAATRQHGIQTARGEFIAFLDVDDLWSHDKLARQIMLLHENPATLIVNGYTQLLRLVDARASEWRFEKWGEPILAFSFGSALFRRKVFTLVGALDDTQLMAEDLDWFLRAREKNAPLLLHTDVTQFYRRHTRNMSNNINLGKQQLLRMLQKSLTRRGAYSESNGMPLPALSLDGQE